jgi:DNA-binding NtrC family response regulator
MVYGFIQRHNGTVDIESALGEVTTFHLHLPIQQSAPGSGSNGHRPTVASSLRILVIDDEIMLRQILASYLAIDHHVVETASGGKEGLTKFREGRFDLVVTDRAMPDLSGDQLAREIKSIAPNKPVILLTGFGELMLADGTRPEAVDLIVSKPVTLNSLRDALTQVLKG